MKLFIQVWRFDWLHQDLHWILADYPGSQVSIRPCDIDAMPILCVTYVMSLSCDTPLIYAALRPLPSILYWTGYCPLRIRGRGSAAVRGL